MPGDLVQGNEILIGVLEATVRDPSGRAPAPNYLAASGATCSSASAGVPSPIFTSARRRRQGALQLPCVRCSAPGGEGPSTARFGSLTRPSAQDWVVFRSGISDG